MKDCTCVGTCRGPAGLSDGWGCVLERLRAEQAEAVFSRNRAASVANLRAEAAARLAAGNHVEHRRLGRIADEWERLDAEYATTKGGVG